MYIHYSAEKNGDKRDFVRRTKMVIGPEYDDYYELVSGVQMNERVIVEHSGELYDGCEVFVE